MYLYRRETSEVVKPEVPALIGSHPTENLSSLNVKHVFFPYVTLMLSIDNSEVVVE